jgi:hypothetical protein
VNGSGFAAADRLGFTFVGSAPRPNQKPHKHHRHHNKHCDASHESPLSSQAANFRLRLC